MPTDANENGETNIAPTRRVLKVCKYLFGVVPRSLVIVSGWKQFVDRPPLTMTQIMIMMAKNAKTCSTTAKPSKKGSRPMKTVLNEIAAQANAIVSNAACQE